MWLFLLTLAMVFATTIIAYVVVRLQLVSENDWKPEGAPGLPWLLTLSTVLLLLSSATMHGASRAVRLGSGGRAAGSWMVLTCFLIVGFLVCQTFAWVDLVRDDLLFDESLYAWLFFVLTGLHALHVLCGLPPLALVTVNCLRGRYGTDSVSRSGLMYCAMYWHFLDAIWVVLYLVLLWGTRAG